jgi:hypothetical protein
VENKPDHLDGERGGDRSLPESGIFSHLTQYVLIPCCLDSARVRHLISAPFAMNRVLIGFLALVICGIGHPHFSQGAATTAGQSLVSALHPRVFVRNDKARIGKGVTVELLRQRLHNPAYATWRREVTNESPSTVVEKAARYLEEGKAADFEVVRRFLLTHTYSYAKHDVEGFLAGAEMATAFDWIYSGLSITDRAAVMANIVTTADSSLDFILHGEPDINHNYTYMALGTLGICGLVLKGEADPYNRKAEEYLASTRQWIEGPGKILETWKARQGAWAEGSHYTFHETLRNLVMLLQAFRSATDIDYFRRIERQYDNFLAKAGQFLIASSRPDLTFERIGDCSPSRVSPILTVPVTVEALAAGLRNPREASRLRSFVQEICEAYGSKAVHPAFDWGMRVFEEPAASRNPSYRTYPLSLRMGAGTDDRMVFRNGWGSNSTMITIVAGDQYTDHQHFDKGQFLIYRGGGLAVDSGGYDSLYKPGKHWNNYSCRTLAHNCLLVYNPQEPLPAGYSNDGGQLVLRGLQHHPDWLAYRTHYKKERLDTAQVLAYDADEQAGYGYVRCDLTAAYGEKVTAYDRQYLYLPRQDYLVVFDRVTAVRPEFEKRWLLHFQDCPTIDGATPQAGVYSFANARLVKVQRNGQLKLENRTYAYDGTLYVQTLLPEDHIVTTVGGNGFEFYNLFEKVNYTLGFLRNGEEPREAGIWRIEVAPVQSSREDQFLHAIQMGTSGSGKPAAVTLIHDTQQKLIGAHFLGTDESQVVFFAGQQKGGPVTLPVTFVIESPNPARVFLLEILSFEQVVVEVNGTPLRTRNVGPRGVFSFVDNSKGVRQITIKSARKS